MIALIPKPAISPRRKALALAVAAAADTLQVFLFPAFGEGFLSPADDILDFVVAVILIGICGFKWQFILAFLLEAIPAFDLLPTWTAVVLLLPTSNANRTKVTQLNHSTAASHPPIEVTAVVMPSVQGSSDKTKVERYPTTKVP